MLLSRTIGEGGSQRYVMSAVPIEHRYNYDRRIVGRTDRATAYTALTSVVR